MSVTEASLALPPPPAPGRPRVLLVGTALVSAAIVMAFAGLLGIYLSARTAALKGSGTWLPAGVKLSLTPGNVSMFTLLLSAVTMWWAVDAVGRNHRRSAYLA